MKNIKLSSLIVTAGISLVSLTGCKPSAESACKDAGEIAKWSDKELTNCKEDLQKVSDKDKTQAEQFIAAYKTCKDSGGPIASACVTGVSMCVSVMAGNPVSMPSLPVVPAPAAPVPAPAAPAPMPVPAAAPTPAPAADAAPAKN